MALLMRQINRKYKMLFNVRKTAGMNQNGFDPLRLRRRKSVRKME